MAALFLPEVIALFPDGLPPTVDEATDILRQAGLFDPDPSWSIDGDAWTPAEMSLPDDVGDLSQLTAAGDRLTIAGATRPTEDRGPWIVTVASTTDLPNWNTAPVTLPGQTWTETSGPTPDVSYASTPTPHPARPTPR